MSTDREGLAALARGACEFAHAPYSGIHVGAAILSVTGATYTGTNVENAAYPLGNCAEASAIAAGVQAEGARFRIAETAVWAFDRRGPRDRDLAVRRLPPAHPRVRGGRQSEGALSRGRAGAFEPRLSTSSCLMRSSCRARQRSDLAAAGIDPHQARRRGARRGRSRADRAWNRRREPFRRAGRRVRDGRLSPRHEPRGMRGLHAGDARQRRGLRLARRVAARPGARQAFDRRRRRPRLARARTDARGLRGLRPDDRRPRARAHRRHARQARIDSGLPVAACRPIACAGPCARPASRSSAPAIASRRPTGACTRSATSRRPWTACRLIVASILSKKLAAGLRGARARHQVRQRRGSA